VTRLTDTEWMYAVNKIMAARYGWPTPIYGPVLPETPYAPIAFNDELAKHYSSWYISPETATLTYPEIMAQPHMQALRKAYEDGYITSAEYNAAIEKAVAAYTDIETPEAAPKYEDIKFTVEQESDGSQTITAESFPDSTLIGDGVLDHPTPYCYREKNKVVINVSNGYAEYVLGEPSLSSRATEAHRVYLKEK
jgi:hypothetical protein